MRIISHNELGVSEVRAKRGFGRNEVQPDTHLLDECASTERPKGAKSHNQSSKNPVHHAKIFFFLKTIHFSTISIILYPDIP